MDGVGRLTDGRVALTRPLWSKALVPPVDLSARSLGHMVEHGVRVGRVCPAFADELPRATSPLT